jgi:uncharacterized membrane protein
VSVFAEEIANKIAENMDVNEENIFDKSQEKNRLKRNINYLAIAAAIIIMIILIATLVKKKKEKPQK